MRLVIYIKYIYLKIIMGNLLNLNEIEKKELISMMENYFDDEVEGASHHFPSIKKKLEEAEALSSKELSILSLCLKREIEDFYMQAEHKKRSKIYEAIDAKIQNLI